MLFTNSNLRFFEMTRTDPIRNSSETVAKGSTENGSTDSGPLNMFATQEALKNIKEIAQGMRKEDSGTANREKAKSELASFDREVRKKREDLIAANLQIRNFYETVGSITSGGIRSRLQQLEGTRDIIQAELKDLLARRQAVEAKVYG